MKTRPGCLGGGGERGKFGFPSNKRGDQGGEYLVEEFMRSKLANFLLWFGYLAFFVIGVF